MKSVKEYVKEINNSALSFRTIEKVKEAGYFDIRITDFKKRHLYIEWLIKNYPNDYIIYGYSFYFSNKDIAILMRLSIE
jgi:hypothetical protein